MFVSGALALLAASAASPQPSASTTAPAEKPRKICRSEAVIGSMTPKRVCTIVPPRSNDAAGQNPKPADPQASSSGR
jgi:hypothetical protein